MGPAALTGCRKYILHWIFPLGTTHMKASIFTVFTHMTMCRNAMFGIMILVVCWCDSSAVYAQSDESTLTRRASIISARSTHPEKVNIGIRSIDISRFPMVSIILDARDSSGRHYPALNKSDLMIYQDRKAMKLESLERISTENSVPVDIVLVIDQTYSMQPKVNEVKANIAEFTQRLSARGVDYRLGMISFGDRIERRREFTEDVNEFIGWIDELRIGGGGDTNENALEGMFEASELKFRNSAQRIIICISDAMYHQKGDNGDARTEFTTESMAGLLMRKNIRLFAVTPPDVSGYSVLADVTRGRRFDFTDNFSSILDEFSESITNLYAVRYRLPDEVPPESINLEIRNSADELVLVENVTILDVDKKFILEESILFDFNEAKLNASAVPDLNRMVGILKAYPAIEVEVRGHTDFIGSNEYNIALSDARARAVKRYFTNKGINSYRVKTRGMGKSYPIAPNDTERGRQLNRRTEIIITKK
jgi:outer membrane protein OmpA-like peptidoglycan-associated protein/Mg-chelatase subunit ChlD